MAAGHRAAAAMVCAVAGLSFGAMADDEPADPEVFSQGGVSWTDPSIVAKTVGGRTVLIVTNVAAAATVTVERTVTLARALVVGGGGGGGSTIGGGGGGGGATEWSDADLVLEAGGALEISIGRGGIGGGRTGNTASTWPRGTNGGASTLTLVGGEWSIEALGGGGGGAWNQTSANGGTTVANPGGPCHGAARPAAGTSGYLSGTSSGESPGGGAGAGGDGGNGVNGGAAGDGGIGHRSDITGEYAYYGGGGAGSGGNSCKTGGKGGLGGGANGVDVNAKAADTLKDGVNGLGGGGAGGSHNQSNNGGNGGSGCVILVFAEGDLTERQLVVAEIPDQPFDGEPSVPAPVVTNKKSGEPLSAEDYDVTYSNNFGIGTATVTVVGKGEYLGERKVLAFEIVLPSEEDRISLAGDFSPKSIREGIPARIACLQVLDANGEPVDPLLYEVGYANNLVRGTATVWAKMKSGDLTGVVAVRTFEVVRCLPAEYEYVEWIASSGDQWIDTGVVPKQATTGVDIRFGQVKNAGNQVIFAQAWSWGNGFLFQVNPAFRFDNNKTLDGYAAGRDYHVTIAPGGIVTMDYGQGVVTNTGYSNGTGSQTLGLFAPNGGGNYRSTFRLYSFQMTSGEVVVSDLLPVRRISDGKPGLYDFAQADPEKAFLVNKRTGTDFTSGPAVTHFDVAPIPVQTYRGVPLTPPLTLTDKATGMEVSTNDFTIAYTNNDAACIATVTVAGKPGTAYEGESRDVTFAIGGILRVTGDAMDTGSGASWADAMTWTNALQRAVTSDVPHEIWVSGTTLLTANTSYSFTKWPVTIRGGFTGTETDPDERATNAVATVDAQDTIKYGLNLSNGANAPVVIERISFIRGVVRSLTRSGAGDFTLRNCRMALRTKENGNTPGTLYDGNNSGTGKRTTGGGGANLAGSGDARLVVEGCSFDGNNVRGEWTGSGPAMWVGGFKTVLFENTSFTTNWWKYSRQGAYACIQLYNQPNATFRGCDFRGNYGQGEILELEGSCGGTVFQNCVFAGNECSGSSLVLANLDAVSSTVAFTNCTFAYNFLSSGCAIRVAKGMLTATSTIFHRNLMGNASTLGADVALTSADASALLSYCSFEDTKGDYLSATADGSLVCANCIRIVDPMFVTATDAFMSELKVTTFPRATYTPGYNRRSGYDVHLMSSAGHFANDGFEHVAEGVYSPAIDKGEKASTAWQDEPEPNGGRVNLGAYGGTDRASKTVPSDPTVDPAAISVTYPGEYSQPLVTFAMAGEGIYSRDVVVSVLTNGVVTFSPVTLPSLTNGQAVACLMPGYLVRGDSMTVRIEIEGVVTPIVSAAFEVQGELPPWTGKGGDPTRVIHVRTGATGRGDGTSWTDAFETLAEALANRAASIEEIWFSGTNVYSVAPATCSFATPFAIRGGFTGSENAASERRPGARSVIDAAYKGRALKISNSADVVLDGLLLTRGSVHNLERSGAGNLTLTNCALTCCSGGTLYDGNGSGSANRNQGGGGFCLSGSGASELLVVDSEIGGNQAGGEWVASGCGGWMSGFKSATFEGTLFATNSHNSGRNGCMAAVLQVNGVPTAFRRCAFRGNSCAGGDFLHLNGNCGGTVFENCEITGNYSSGGPFVTVSLGAADQTAAFTNCTFAYNYMGGNAELRCAQGAVTVHNSIFHRNHCAAGLGVGVDLHAASATASAYVDWTYFDALTATYCSQAADSSLELVDCATGYDPLFVTSTEEFAALTGTGETPVTSKFSGTRAQLASFDVHLLSSEGYFDATGGLHQAADVLSGAIDGGAPSDDYSNEMVGKNGNRINLGAYGNTRFASLTPYCAPAVEDLAVEFECEFSQPTVTFTPGGEGTYSGVAVVRISTNGTDWCYVSEPLKGLSVGVPVSHRVPTYFLPGTRLTVRVELSGGGTDVADDTDPVDVEGRLPPWYGKGGPANVLHVRPGATGKGDGTSWTDAFETLAEALANRTASIEEIWFAGTNVYSAAPATYSFAAPFAIRGGFTGSENAASERRPGARSVIDAAYKGRALKISNSADVVLDGLLLTRGSVHNLERSGAGNLTLTNCATTCCSGGTLYDGNNSQHANRNEGGAGFCLTGSGASELLVVDSEVGGNQAGGEWVASGCGGWMSGFKSATFEGTLFATNMHTSGRNGCFGGILQANGVPITFRRCAFRGNYSAGGDLLHLNGNCGGTVFENCIFAGNSGSSNNSGGKGVVDVALGAMESAVCFRNCTFAYNICGNAGALYVEKGTAAVTNSVFFGNVTHRSVTKGADITLNAPGCADIARTLFAEGEFTNYVSSVTNEHVTVSEVLRGDPQFVTSAEDFKAAYKVSDLPRSNSTFPKHAVAVSPNLHLRGGSGYVDETTGGTVKTWAKRRYDSPAIDAGDPAVRCVEPKPNGHRVNLGFYGNTPWATMSKGGTALIVR